MTEFKKFRCTKCQHIQLENKSKLNSLIIEIVCRNCWHKEVLCNILGSK